MKVALIHDYLIDYGGAERVLLVLHELFPKAPIYTLIVDERGMGSFWEKFKDVQIKTSWFNNVPFASRLISPFRFLIPFLWASFVRQLADYDLVISSASWAVTKGFDKKVGGIEICYVHTPPRYLYGYETSRVWQGKWYGKIIDFYALIVNHFMRQYDFARAQRVDYFIANSKNIQARIKKFYRHDATVIYPPIDLPHKQSLSFQDKSLILNRKSLYFLAGGRMVASKNFDLIIEACKKANVSLRVFGSGVEEESLRRLANDRIVFLGKVGDDELADLYSNAEAFIVAQKDEDFGMTVIEANAYGCPVIAYRGGGYLETVIPGKTGIFFDRLTVDSLVYTLQHFDKVKWDKKLISRYAQKFSKERFKKEILAFMEQKLQK